MLPRTDGPTLALVGIGDPAKVDAAALRDAAAVFTRASATHARLAIDLERTGSVPPKDAAHAVVEGVLLARYRYDPFHTNPSTVRLAELTLVAGGDRAEAIRRGAEQGRLTAEACMLTRDVGNAPPSYMTAERMAEVAQQVAAERGLSIEVFDRQALVELGCGGLLGVNAGSVHEPRMIKLTLPAQRHQPRSPGAGGQGHHVRRRRHQPEARRCHASADEARHGGRRRHPGRDVGHGRARVLDHRHRLPDVHRQHALRVRHEDGRRPVASTAARRSKSRTPTPKADW